MEFMRNNADKVVVIGAGIGGLAAGLRLAAAGLAVTLCEAHPWPGGKLRSRPSNAGPVDAGPTVLTLRAVFDELFELGGLAFEAAVPLVAQPRLARHWWSDGAQLDLYADRETSADAIGQTFGAQSASEFRHFDACMARLYATFEAPMMAAARPDARAAGRAALRAPAIWPMLLPGRTLAGMLRRQFTEPRLRQLFGRYATYVGGTPDRSPAVLGLIWRAEAAGVWTIRGGLHQLADALAELFRARGGTLRLNTRVARIETQAGAVAGVVLEDGTRVSCARVVFNGDPAALGAGLLGTAARGLLAPRATGPRSLSARVWSFAARARGLPLGHHNLLFADTEAAEFVPLARGLTPDAPTIYVCAQDRTAASQDAAQDAGQERFQFILNAPAGDPKTPAIDREKEAHACLTQTFDRLNRFGLSFDPLPDPAISLTLPQDFAALFPASRGALYGRSPHAALAPFLRPTARTRLPGLYLAGGATHPGAGLPMAALSGAHAANAVLADRASTPRFRPTAMRGGISMQSVTTGRARSR